MSGGSYIGNSSHGIISSIDGGTISNATLDSSVTFPAGTVLQVQSKNETAIRNTSTTSFEEIHTDFFAELTTKKNNSKILVNEEYGSLTLIRVVVIFSVGSKSFETIVAEASVE